MAAVSDFVRFVLYRVRMLVSSASGVRRSYIECGFALIGDPLVLALQHHTRFAAVLAACLAPCDTPLCHSQAPLGGSIPARVLDLLAVAGGVQMRQAHISPDRLFGLGQRLSLCPL